MHAQQIVSKALIHWQREFFIVDQHVIFINWVLFVAEEWYLICRGGVDWLLLQAIPDGEGLMTIASVVVPFAGSIELGGVKVLLP